MKMREIIIASATAAAIIMLGPVLLNQISNYVHPPEKWLTMTNFRAEDAVVGDAPVVLADRVVHRSVLAKMRVTLREVMPTGGSTRVCSRATEVHLIPQSVFPTPTTLNYWSESPPNPECLPEHPGRYFVTLWVTVEGDDGVRTSPIELISNEFNARAPTSGETPQEASTITPAVPGEEQE